MSMDALALPKLTLGTADVVLLRELPSLPDLPACGHHAHLSEKTFVFHWRLLFLTGDFYFSLEKPV